MKRYIRSSVVLTDADLMGYLENKRITAAEDDFINDYEYEYSGEDFSNENINMADLTTTDPAFLKALYDLLSEFGDFLENHSEFWGIDVDDKYIYITFSLDSGMTVDDWNIPMSMYRKGYIDLKYLKDAFYRMLI